MKKTITRSVVFLLLTAYCFLPTAYSQVPQAFNYQAVARYSSGALIANQAIGLRFSILQGSPTGTVVYEETQSVTTNQFGLFTPNIGKGTVVTGIFSSINWSSGLYWLKVEMDPTGGTSYVYMGTSQLLSVPYALCAGKSSSDTLWKLNGNNIYYNNGYVGIGTTSPQGALDVKGSVFIQSANYNYNENLRLYPSTYNDYSSIQLGAVAGSSGTGVGQWAFVRHPASDNYLFNIRYNNNDFFNITNSGNVGIGTITPAHALAVKPQTDIDAIEWQRNADGAVMGTLGVSGGTGTGRYGWLGLWNATGTSTVQIQAGGASFFNGGNIGIGTNTPTHKLEIWNPASTADSTGNLQVFSNGNGNYSSAITAYDNNSGQAVASITNTLGQLAVTATISGWPIAMGVRGHAFNSSSTAILGSYGSSLNNPSCYGYLGGNTTGAGGYSVTANAVNYGLNGTAGGSGTSTNYGLYATASGGTDNYAGYFDKGNVIVNSGNVGIGTTSPLTVLHVVAPSPAATVATTRAFAVTSNDASNPFALDIRLTGAAALTNRSAYIQTTNWNLADGGNILLQPDGGNVGIGTTNPIGNLHVAADANNVFVVSNAAGTGNILKISGNNTVDVNYPSMRSDGINLVINPSNSGIGSLYLNFDVGAHNTYINANGGKVGIGTSSPDDLLSVNGTADKPGGGSWGTFSDERVKKEVNGFTDGLNIIRQINPVTFKYNGLGGYKEDGKQYVGIIAQDIQKIAPYMIEVKQKKLHETDLTTTDLLMYDGSAITYILINAVKEQQEMIDSLKLVNGDQSAVISNLQSAINKQQSAIGSMQEENGNMKSEIEKIEQRLNMGAKK